MPDQPIGPVLDGLGATLDLPDGALVEQAVVITKIVHEDGSVALALSDSAGLCWIDQLGLLSAATQIVNERPFQHPDDE